jgi:hypothetical protein
MFKLMNIVDTESKMRGLGTFLNNFRPVDDNDSGSVVAEAPNKEQLLKLPRQEITRQKGPCKILDTPDRFENVFKNPQEIEHIIMNEKQRGGLGTREFEKNKLIYK